MPLSLRYIFNKVKKSYPDSTLAVIPGVKNEIAGKGIISPRMSLSDELLYFDLDTRQARDAWKLSEVSVVTVKGRARLFERCNVIAVPDSTDIRDVFWLVSDALEDYHAWSRSIMAASSNSKELQPLIDLSRGIVGNPIVVVNSGYQVVACTDADILAQASPIGKYLVNHKYFPFDAFDKFIASGDLLMITEMRNATKVSLSCTECPVAIMAVYSSGKCYGYLAVPEMCRTIDDFDIEIIDKLGSYIARNLSDGRSTAQNEEESRIHFIADIIDGRLVEKERIRHHLDAFGQEVDGDFAVLLFDSSKENGPMRHYIVDLLHMEIGAQCFIHEKQIIAIINGFSKCPKRYLDFIDELINSFRNFAALSEPFEDLAYLRAYYREAAYVLDTMEAMGGLPRLGDYKDFFPKQIRELCASTIPPFTPVSTLRKYDDEHHAELCLTLYIWLLSDRNSSDAAQRLYIHRNTLKQRLERIKELIDIDFDDMDIRLRLIFSLGFICEHEDVLRYLSSYEYEQDNEDTVEALAGFAHK